MRFEGVPVFQFCPPEARFKVNGVWRSLIFGGCGVSAPPCNPSSIEERGDFIE